MSATTLNPMDHAPKDGSIIHVQQESLYRWLPYSDKSPQARKGLAGRWQRFDGTEWKNEILTGTGWKFAEVAQETK